MARHSDRPARFRARIHRIGILRCVDVPPEVGAVFAEWRHPPVRATVDGVEIRTHMSPAGEGAYRLYLDGDLRKKIGADSGDEVELSVELDESLQAEPYPDDLLELAEGMDGGPLVLRTLPPGLKRQILKFLDDAKSEPVRAKRLDRIAEIIAERAAKLDLEDEG